TSKIHKELGIEFPLRDVFLHTTIKSQASQIEISTKKDFVSIPKAKEQTNYPLSPAQKRLYLLQQFDLTSTAYNMPGIIPLGKEADKLKIEEVFKQLINRHESFRTSIIVTDGEPVQLIKKDVKFELEEISIENTELENTQNKFIKPFDLSKAPFLRVAFVDIKGEDSFLMFDMHHIISDGTSHSILEKEFQALLLGEELAPLSLQYKDYSQWQNSNEQQERVKDQEKYWLNKFEGEIPVLNLPTDYVRPLMQSHEGATVGFVLSKEETEGIKFFTKENDLTIYMSLLSIFSILLSKLSGQEDIIVGTPIAGRNHADLENIVGMFINTLSIRNEVKGEETIQEFVSSIKQTVLGAYENQNYQFEDLVDKVSVERDTSRNPIFDVVINLLNQAEHSGDISRFNNTEWVHEIGISKFDLTLTAEDFGDQLMLSFEYCTQLFKAETINRIIAYFKKIVSQISQNPKWELSEIEIISAEEKQQILYAFNNTKVSYLEKKSIAQVFKEQVKEFTKKIALEDKDKSYTYQELDEESNKIANYLIKHGVTEDQLVGLMAGRSSDMIIGILGILKTGGGYVPIDPAYPKERVNQLIEDSGINILLSTEAIDFEYNLSGGIINISDLEIKESSTDLSLPSINSSNIAYVMYTSGSTGTPKGVVIEQKSVLRLVQNNQFFPFHSEQKILMTGAPVFDATTFEIWGALLNGGSLYIASNEVIINSELLGECIRKNSITSLWLTSSLCNQLLDQNESVFDTLKFLLVGGDVLSVKHINKIKTRNSELVLINGYGPTENTTFSTTLNIEKEYDLNIPIGKPISNSTAYIFDKSNKLQAVGVPGELLVGGDGLAREYLNNPELTREKFIENPYKEGERLYKTGDLTRWLPDGNIEFLGRIDQQVKIRGFRIELGEIESLLQKQDQIKESVVLAREENGEKYLCAYLVIKEDYNEEEIRTYLSANLPDYMIPSYFVTLEKIPLNSNGKLNRKALPSPEIKAGDNYVAPSTEIEEKLLEIWSEILNIDKEDISVNANFFSIGGHSLKANVLTSKIHKEIGVEFPLRDVFVHTTIEAQASQIEKSTKKEFVSIPKAKEQSNYPLSPAQKRMYLLQQFDLTSTAYNMPNIIPLGKEADKSKIEEVFKQLINRHESFRTSIIVVDQEPVQYISKDVEFEIEEISIENTEAENIRNKFIKPFDLSQAPFLRAAIVDIKGKESLLMIDMHHIISDGTTHEILEKEFLALLSGEELVPLPLQYKDYSQWQNSKEQQELIKDQEQYWLNKFEGEIPVLNLPTDYTRPLMQSHEGATVSFVLSKEETKGLRIFTEENELTLYMSLLSVYNILLSKLSGQYDIVVGTPIAGRNHADLENIVGMFLNTLSMRTEINGEATIPEFVSSIKQTVLGAYENQDYQFEDLVNKVSIERDVSRNPIFDVMFNMLNQRDYSGDLVEESLNIHEKIKTKFDLNFKAIDFGDQILLTFEYNTSLFSENFINRLICKLEKVVKSINERDEKLKIKEIEIIPEKEKQEKLTYFNEKLECQIRNNTVQARLNETYNKFKDKIAIEIGDKYISYSELEARKKVVSNWILGKAIKKESLVGILVDDRSQVIISILGILDSSCVFVPIDINLPANRIKAMIETVGINYFVTCDKGLVKLNEILPEIQRENVFVYGNAVDITDIDSYEDRSLSTDAVYIYFTSGSTGKPKAIAGKNESLVQFIDWEIDRFNVDDSFRVSQLINIGFDVYLRDIFLPLLSGGTICIPLDNKMVLDGFQLTQWMNRKQISLVHCVPSVFNVFGNEYIENSFYAGLKYVLMSGEQIIPANLIKWYTVFSNRIRLVNLYGPTETTLARTCYFIQPDDVKKKRLTIGQAITGSRIIILDKDKNVCEAGISGELYIRTAYSSLGYYKNSQMTREKFVDNPFKKDDNNLLYRTGDVAIENSNAEIEITGRIDHQIKIRGFRIELGEIESTLLKHKNIKESVVLAIEENNDKYLCAYVVCKEELSHEEIRSYISLQLPDYMVPTYIVELEKLPLNTNGKVNRKALPAPEINAGDDYVAASNEIEEKLVKIWSEVLNIEKEAISTTANFFSIGGHSLKATVLTSKIHKEIGVEFPLREVFLHPTIKSQASQIEISAKKKFVSIPKTKEQSNYPVSSAQKRLYLLQQFDLTSTAYNMPYVIPLGKEVDKSKIEEVFKQLINRHENFRTSVTVVDGAPVQIISKNVEFELEELNIENTELENTRNKFIKPFALSKAPLLRVSIVNIKGEASLLMIDMHHIISDGTSRKILERDFQALLSGKELAPLPLQYKDYSQWQNSKEQQELIKNQEQYWLNKFAGEIPVLNLPSDYVRSLIQSHEGATVNFVLSKEETEGLRFFTEENDLTLYMSLLSVFTILLSKLSGQEDIVVGTPIAGRNHADLENIVGMFVNTLSIRNELKGEETIQEFVSSLKQTVLGAYENQNYQFEDLVDKASVERDTSRNPIFDVMINLLNQAEHSGDISGIDNLIHIKGVSKFDLTLTAIDYEEQLLINFNYCTQLFKAETIDRFIAYFKQIVSQIAKKAEIKISAIDILTKEDKRQLLYEFNDTKKDYSKNKSIHQFIEEQATVNPDNISIVFEENQISYSELNRKANQLAHYLRRKGVDKNSIVSLFFEPSLDMLISIVGVLKSGAIFLPIVCDFPEERIKYILEDSGSEVVLKNSKTDIADIKVENIIDIDRLREDNSNDLLNMENSFNSAYIIYTSGTSGKPKGVIVSHQNIVNYINWFGKSISFNKNDRSVLNTTYTFDAIYTLLFGTLFYGGRLNVIPKQVYLDPNSLIDYIDKENITVIKMIPILFNAVLGSDTFDKQCLKTLRFLMLGGETVNVSDVEKFHKKNKKTIIMNHYGPTETTVGSIATIINTDDLSSYAECSYIGKPIDNTEIYILNKFLQVQPIMVSGELFISGDGLAIGYLNNEELTTERFVNHPFKEGERLYRTGDLARCLPDGNVEFLGRIDHQVKIRGNRIEINEIQSILLKHENIKESIVLAIGENNDKYLCAYVVCKKEFKQEELRAYM
ncbi:MAG: amino acid adenylation domain-containing protein, partial [Bacteroidales bacterium]|nr:amino acid adenylation domain-containing protein [Bacteroidales bacterium]